MFKGLHKNTQEVYAIKIIQLANISKFDRPNISKEIEIHSQLNHPNIVKLFDFLNDAQNVYLILEFHEGGNLFNFLNDR